jgi:hypothetical protein
MIEGADTTVRSQQRSIAVLNVTTSPGRKTAPLPDVADTPNRLDINGVFGPDMSSAAARSWLIDAP